MSPPAALSVIMTETAESVSLGHGTIHYHRVKWPETIRPPYPDYWIRKSNSRIGYVSVDRAGRQSGTISRWRAVIWPDHRIGTCSTFRRLKEEVDRFTNRGDGTGGGARK
jgi:hypothetical protein